MAAPILASAHDGLQPGRLWSLWDIMQRFHANSFAAAVGLLHRAGATLAMANQAQFGPHPEMDRQVVKDTLKEIKPEFSELPLSRVLRDQLERLEKYAETVDTRDTLAMLLIELNSNIMVELSSAYFLMVPAWRREYYQQRLPLFGNSVATIFAKANRDIAAAGRCFALDEWTACVFHLMRVLEHGLRTMGADVVLSESEMSNENWKNVIDQIESKIHAMEGERKSAEKIEKLKKFSLAAAQFRYFKDAWRNHVSHANETYDEREAITVYTHVKMFMEQLASAFENEGQPS